MSEARLTQGMLEAVARLRGVPVGPRVAAHLLSMFGEGGRVAQIAAAQAAAWEECPHNDGHRCYDGSCGYCAPYRQGPLLDEVLDEIRAFEGGDLYFDEEGGVRMRSESDLPF